MRTADHRLQAGPPVKYRKIDSQYSVKVSTLAGWFSLAANHPLNKLGYFRRSNASLSETRADSSSQSSRYLVLGQKNPLSPSLRRRGTTCMCRCGTLWLTRLFTATKDPLRSKRLAPPRWKVAWRSETEVPTSAGGQVAQCFEMLFRNKQERVRERAADGPERHIVSRLPTRLAAGVTPWAIAQKDTFCTHIRIMSVRNHSFLPSPKGLVD